MMGDVLVASACVAYLGAFSSAYRDELKTVWLENLISLQIPASKTFR